MEIAFKFLNVVRIIRQVGIELNLTTIILKASVLICP